MKIKLGLLVKVKPSTATEHHTKVLDLESVTKIRDGIHARVELVHEALGDDGSYEDGDEGRTLP